MGKSNNHKTENTFKYQSFSERIANVNIDVIHKIRQYDYTPEESGTHFGEALEQWIELNCTEHFSSFRREISDQVQSFTQLVHHEEEIVKALQKHLQIPNSLALEPLLDLLVQLARDLQKDFYPHFADFFHLLVELLEKNPQNAELLEKLFSALSYLFKFLWRYLVVNIQDVYKYFSVLLGQNYQEYIRNFASESFAFLMRKVKNHSELFDFLFLSLEDAPDTAEGVGRLLFEMMKGVSKQFHSCTEKVFPILLSKLGECQDSKKVVKLPWDQVMVAISHTFRSMAEYTSRDHTSSIWSMLMSSTEEIHKILMKKSKLKKDEKKASSQLCHLLQLTKDWFSYRHGYIIADPDQIAKSMLPLLQEKTLSPDIGEILLDALSSLLVTSQSRMTVHTTAKLVNHAFKAPYNQETIFKFSSSLLDLPIFEKDVLPSLLSYIRTSLEKKDEDCKVQIIHHLTQVLMKKSPAPLDGSQLSSLHVYLLDFGPDDRFPQYVWSVIEDMDMTNISIEKAGLLWSALVCLPHLRPLNDRDLVIRKIQHIAERSIQFIQSKTEPQYRSEQDLCLCLLHQCLIHLMHLSEPDQVFKSIELDQVSNVLRSYSSNTWALKFADLYFTYASEEDYSQCLTEDVLLQVFPFVKENISSPYTKVRMLTLRILSQFHMRLPKLENEENDRLDVFRICLEAELCPLTVQDFRTRHMYLTRLNFDVVQNSLPPGQFSLVPLRYLIGSLYINFKLIWEPVRDLINSHARGLDKNVFWEFFKYHLTSASTLLEESLKSSIDKISLQISRQTPLKIFSDWLASVDDMDKPDFANLRLQLWKAMHLFPEKCEPKSRDLVPIFFKFLSNEYYPADLQVAPTQDVRKDQFETGIEVTEEPEEEPIEETCRVTRSSVKLKREKDIQQLDETEEKGGKKKLRNLKKGKNINKDTGHGESTKSKKQRRAATSALLAHLELFSKFQNPKSLYKEADLRSLYFQLLVHKDPEVQKEAFNCIMAYKHKYLMPYKENFERLLDDKTFKNEIVLFSIDQDNGVIKAEHRAELLPVVMRILYGKMQFKTGNDTAGKAHSNVRRSIVLRFLNGCEGHELLTFLDMVFEPYKHFINDDPLVLVQKVITELDISKITPLRKITGTFHTIDMVVKKLGHMLTDYLPSLLKIILGLTATCVSCLEKRNLISRGAVNTLKNLRQIATARILQFFQDFDSYGFTPHEIDAVFEVLVWPQLSKLPFEGLYSPTPLLKMLHMFSTNRRFTVLLSKHHKDDKEVTPMPFVVKLLNAPDVNESVTTCIIEILDNLLSIQEEEVGDITMEVPLEVDNVLYHNQDYKEISMHLVKEHVPTILQYIKACIVNLKSKMKDGKSNKPQKVLSILSRISEFTTDQNQCQTLVELLVPYLGQGVRRSLDMEHSIMNSIANLLIQIENRYPFYRNVASLFSHICDRHSRNLLCKVFQVITEKKESLQNVSSLIQELNSWDPKRVEEPDYLCRLGAFRKIIEVIKSMDKSIDVDFLLPMIHNACYCIRQIDDMSLRDNSTHCLVTMVTQIGHVNSSQDVYREVISQTLMPEVKGGMKNKSENVRHEFITVLSALVDAFPDSTMFADLRYIKDVDLEGDFFENIRHIQTHRRSRAMRKIVKLLSNRNVKKEIIVSYFLPITSSFLTDEAYKKAQGLQDSAIETLGKICHHLPWPLYVHQLKYYLQLLPKKLDRQKLYVRVIIAILDAFHFDLQNTEFRVSNLPSSMTQQKAKGIPTEMPEEDQQEEEEVSSMEDKSIDDKDPDVTMEMDQVAVEEEESFVIAEKVVCSASLATKIHITIVKSIIPRLQKVLTEKVKTDTEHKFAKSKYAEDTEILRVPIALAMVRLLQFLPQRALEQSLPGILLKICIFLKSRAKDIRDSARDTLVKILLALGPRFFPYILSELRGALKKGYQVHVLCFTTYILLKNIASELKPGQLDTCRQSLQDVFHEDLFGQVSEEKQVDSIASKLFEAKTVKSYDSYEILAKYIGQDSLLPMLAPLKEKLDSTHSHTISKKIQEIMHRIGLGLIENEGLSTETLMMFIHGLVSESFPMMKIQQSKQHEKNAKTDEAVRRPKSCLLLQAEPKRGGEKPKTSKRTNTHILVEFGLQILQMLLKKSRLTSSENTHLGMMDPFVDVLAECLYSKHIRINTISLRCLSWMMRFSLPSLQSNIEKLTNGMFVLLKNYASAGSAKGDNLELIAMAFKAVTVLVRDVKFHTITTEQLQVLLSFCEEDLHDYNRQSTAFSLLRAILSRKLNVAEMTELISNIESMAVTADSPHIQRECRQIVLQYLLDYPLGKGIVKHLEFFITQLTFDTEVGRISVLEMMATIFTSFPQSILVQHAGIFFVPMAAALINDDSVKCRKLTALALKSLLQKIDHNCRDSLFSICVKWITDKKMQHRALGCQVMGLFVEVEAAKFENRLSSVLPIIEQQIEPGRYESQSETTKDEGALDSLLYNCLNALLKICRETNALREKKWADIMDTILDHVQNHLVYPHSWVRLSSSQLFGMLFSQWTAEEIVQNLSSEKPTVHFILKDSLNKMEGLTTAFITQLQSHHLSEELANQVIKNLVFIAKVAKLTAQCALPENADGNDEKPKRLSVLWLVKKMMREANHEAVSNTKVTIKRSSVFKWIAAVSLDIGEDVLSSVIRLLLPPLQREISDANPTDNPELKNLAQEVLEILKKILGVENYTKYFTEVQSHIFKRKEERKRKRATDLITNPELAVKRKLKKNLAKQEAKKRKADGHRVAKVIKKRKTMSVEINS